LLYVGSVRGVHLLAPTMLLACFRPHADADIACSASGYCPAGQSCDTTQQPALCVPVGAQLAISSTTLGSGDVDLTAEGTVDWIHWGQNGGSSVDRKASGSGLGGLASPPQLPAKSVPFTASWSDGTPDVMVSMTATGVGDIGSDLMMQLSASADTTFHTLRVYGFVESAQLTLTASLSDDSAMAAPIVVTADPGRSIVGKLTILYRAAGSGQTVTVTLQSSKPDATAAIGVMSATLE
jgi:hypothetical protein